MKFLVDAQLPIRFVGWRKRHGHDAVHTVDLPLGNRTPDSDLVACAKRDDRIVVTKDSDFVQTHNQSICFDYSVGLCSSGRGE